AAAALGAREAEGDVAGDVEEREEGVLLRDVADAPGVRGDVETAGGVEERLTPDAEVAAHAGQKAGERLEGERLAHAGGAEDHEHARIERQLRLDGEGAVPGAH